MPIIILPNRTDRSTTKSVVNRSSFLLRENAPEKPIVISETHVLILPNGSTRTFTLNIFRRLFTVLEFPMTCKVAAWYSWFVVLLVCISVVVIVAETVPNYRCKIRVRFNFFKWFMCADMFQRLVLGKLSALEIQRMTTRDRIARAWMNLCLVSRQFKKRLQSFLLSIMALDL